MFESVNEVRSPWTLRGNQKASGRHIHYLVDHRFRCSHPRESASAGRPSRRRPGVNSASLKVIYLWFMEGSARRGSRKFLGFSATRRKELSAGHNGQVAISFTRRIPRPSVPHDEGKKNRVGRSPSSSKGGKENLAGCCELGEFSRMRRLLAAVSTAVEFPLGGGFVMKNLIRREKPELFSTEYFRRGKYFTSMSLFILRRPLIFLSFEGTLFSHASHQLMRRWETCDAGVPSSMQALTPVRLIRRYKRNLSKSTYLLARFRAARYVPLGRVRLRNPAVKYSWRWYSRLPAA